jgi:hypothetical protein
MKKLIALYGVIILSTQINSAVLAQAGLGLRNLQYYPMYSGVSDKEDSLTYRFQFGLHYRWFDAAVPYVGNQRFLQLERDNIHEIFNTHQVVVNLGYKINSRLTVSVNLPLVFNQKSSVLEHSSDNGTIVGNERRVTEAMGLGDIFIMGNYALIPQQKSHTYQLIGGLGVKVPSGDYGATDVWYNAGPGRTDIRRPVDPEIQPGDGAWGIIADLRGRANFLSWLSAYVEARYLSTPTNLNGIRTYRSTLSQQFSEEEEVSVSDQYMVRIGATLQVPSSPVYLSLGIRVDGTPVNDIFGLSDGFRRPGFATSFDSGIAVHMNKYNYYISIPFIYYQDRARSNADKVYTGQTGIFRHGEAPFARFMVLAGVQRVF